MLPTTLRIDNLDNRDLANVPISFGHVFRKGDVPRGHRLRLEMGDGSLLPIQVDQRASWPDGSLRFCAISTQLPQLPARRAAPVRLSAEPGDVDGGTCRSLDEVRAAMGAFRIDLADLRSHDGQVQGSGNWVAKLSDALDAGAPFPVRCGPLAAEWRIWSRFRDTRGGAEHPHLTACWYVRVWTRAGASIRSAPGQVEWIAKVENGWFRVPGLKTLVYTATVRNGETAVMSFGRQAVVRPLATGRDGEARRFEARGHGFTGNETVQVASTGTLPQGLAAETVYYLRVLDADTISLHRTGADAQTNANARSGLPVTGIGSGDMTVRSVLQHGGHSGWFACDGDGRMNWLGGERPRVHVRFDRAYWRASRMLPPFELLDATPAEAPEWSPGKQTVKDKEPPSRPYRPLGVSHVYIGFNEPGDKSQIGMLPSWAAKAFLSQRVSWATMARQAACVLASGPIHVRNEVVRLLTPPTVLATSYEKDGLGKPAPGWRYHPAAGVERNSFAPVAREGGMGQWTGSYQSSWDASHLPALAYYTVLTEANRYLLDEQIAIAAHVAQIAALRTTALGGNRAWHGCAIREDSNSRAGGWALRELSYATAVCPDEDPMRRYLGDILQTNFDYALAAIEDRDAVDPGFKAAGKFLFHNKVAHDQLWMTAFILMGASIAWCQHEQPAAKRFMDHLTVQMQAVMGGCDAFVTTNSHLFRKHTDGRDFSSNPLRAADDIVFNIMGNCSFAADGSNRVVRTPRKKGQYGVQVGHDFWPLAAGTKVVFNTSYPSNKGRPPAPVSLDETYYVVNPNSDGVTFQISRQPGGPPVVWGNAPQGKPGAVVTHWRPVACPSPTPGNTDENWHKAFIGYHTLATSAICLAVAAGQTALAPIAQAMRQRNGDLNYAANPKYAIALGFDA